MREVVTASDQPRPTVPPSAKGEVKIVALTNVQRVIARRMSQSRSTVPDFVLRSRVDMQAVVARRAELKLACAPGQVQPSLNDFIIKSSALALREHPIANGAYQDGEIHLHERVNVGFAVATADRLVVPTVFDADRKSLSAIAGETRLLAARAREGKIKPPDVSGGTFTVSNLGMLGVREFDAVVNPPQAAILSVGEITEEAVVVEQAVVVRHVARLGLACDHRILYGASAAAFFAEIKRLLEAPGYLELAHDERGGRDEVDA